MIFVRSLILLSVIFPIGFLNLLGIYDKRYASPKVTIETPKKAREVIPIKLILTSP
jgi:hypothetical protein